MAVSEGGRVRAEFRTLTILILGLLNPLLAAATSLAPNPNPGLIVVRAKESVTNFEDFLNQGTIQVEGQGHLINRGVLRSEGTLRTGVDGLITNRTGTVLVLPGSMLLGSVDNDADLQIGGTAHLSDYQERGSTHVLASGSLDLATKFAYLQGALNVSGNVHHHEGSLMQANSFGLVDVRAGGNFLNDGTIVGGGAAVNAGMFSNAAMGTFAIALTNEVAGVVVNRGGWEPPTFTNYGTAQIFPDSNVVINRLTGMTNNKDTGVLELDRITVTGSLHNEGVLRTSGYLEIERTGNFTQAANAETQVVGDLIWISPGSLEGRILGDPGSALYFQFVDDHAIDRFAEVAFDYISSSQARLINNGVLRAGELSFGTEFQNMGSFEGALTWGRYATVTNGGHLVLFGSDSSSRDHLHNRQGGVVVTSNDYVSAVTNEGTWISRGDTVLEGASTGVLRADDWSELSLRDFVQAGQLSVGPNGLVLLREVTTTHSSIIENEGRIIALSGGLVGGGTLRQISGLASLRGPVQQDRIELIGGRLHLGVDYEQGVDETLSIQLTSATTGVVEATGHVSFLGSIEVTVSPEAPLSPGLEWIVVQGADIDISHAASLSFPDLSAFGLRLSADVVVLPDGIEGLRLSVAVPETGTALLLFLGLLGIVRHRLQPRKLLRPPACSTR